MKTTSRLLAGCSQMATGLMQDIIPTEGNKIRLIFRNFPLPMHPWAGAAAEATACAQTQNDKYFWPATSAKSPSRIWY